LPTPVGGVANDGYSNSGEVENSEFIVMNYFLEDNNHICSY
jgi:hypothetical protein